jgi:hypothetical protein
MTDHAQTIGALGIEDPWTGGDHRVEVLARVSFEHDRGTCELVASVIRDSNYFGVMCSTYDNRCPHPHEPVKVLTTGTTLFAACLEIYSCRRLNDRMLTIRPEQMESNPPGPAQTHARVQQLWIPPDYVERLYAAAAASNAALEKPLPAGLRSRRSHP